MLAIGITFTVNQSIDSGKQRTVVSIYRQASLNWISGQSLYLLNGHGYLYLPQGAIVFAPWGIMPATTCEFVWRWSIILVAAVSAFRMTKLFNGDTRYFFAISVVSILLGMGAARIGQSTVMIMGLNILAVVEMSERHWWRATLLLTLAFAFKPLGIVLMLLAAALRPQMSYRLAISLLLLAVAPFLTQRPDYVLSQYQECVENMRQTFHVGETEYWAQLFGMLKVFHLEPPAAAKTLTRLVFALATLFVCWKATRQLTAQRSAFYMVAFATVYLMLFHSRTEGNTYAMVGPIYGALIADAANRRKKFFAVIGLVLAVAFTLLHYEFGKLLTPAPREVWVSPLVCVLVTSYLLFLWKNDLREASLKNDAANDLNERSTPVQEVRWAA